MQKDLPLYKYEEQCRKSSGRVSLYLYKTTICFHHCYMTFAMPHSSSYWLGTNTVGANVTGHSREQLLGFWATRRASITIIIHILYVSDQFWCQLWSQSYPYYKLAKKDFKWMMNCLKDNCSFSNGHCCVSLTSKISETIVCSEKHHTFMLEWSGHLLNWTGAMTL